MNVSSPTSPAIVGTIDVPGRSFGVTVSGSYAYVASNSGLHIVDVSMPISPTIVGSAATGHDSDGSGRSVELLGNYAYVGGGRPGVQLVDISDPTSPVFVGSASVTPRGTAVRATVSGNYVYIADLYWGMQIVPVHCDKPVAVVLPGFTGSAVRVTLDPGSPNPFRRETTLRFAVTPAQRARLSIYDVAGRLVRVIARGSLPEGNHQATWDARDGNGVRVGSGLYFVRLEAGGETRTKKVVFLGGG